MRNKSIALTCAAAVAVALGSGTTDSFGQVADTNAVKSGDWSDPTTWDFGEPSNKVAGSPNLSATNAIINGGFNVTITQPGETAFRVDLGTGDAGNTGSLTMNSGDLTVSNPENIAGAFPSIRIGTAPGTTGTFNMNGGAVTVTGPTNGDLAIGDVLLGDNGSGRMDMTGGTITVSDEFILGTQAVSRGNILNLSGGTISTSSTTGRSVIAGFNGEGTINVSGTGNIVSRFDVLIGLFGSSRGTLNVRDSATVVGNVINLANDPNTTATGIQTGGTVTARSFMLIGRLGSATYDHSAGAINVLTGNGDFVIGDLDGPGAGPGTGGRGIYNISGTATLAISDDLFVGAGNETNGRLNQTGGTITVGQTPAEGQDYHVARFGNSVGRVDHSGGGMTTTFMSVGVEGNGTYNLSGTGTVTARREFITGFFRTGVGTFTQSGASTLTAPSVVVGREGASTYTMTGGTLNAATAPATVGPALPGDIRNLIVGRVSTSTFDQSGGTVNVGSATNVANVFLGDFDNSLGTYRISGGALNVAGNFNVGAALASNAPPDATRTATGGQAINVRGTFVVRGSAASINIGGDFLANAADRARTGTANQSNLVFEILDASGTSPINVASAADLDGAVIDLDLFGYEPAPNQVFTLLTAAQGIGGDTGTGSTKVNGSDGEAFMLAAEDVGTWRLEVVGADGGGPESLQAVYAVPEPSALALLGLGGLGLLRRRRAVKA